MLHSLNIRFERLLLLTEPVELVLVLLLLHLEALGVRIVFRANFLAIHVPISFAVGTFSCVSANTKSKERDC
jgi:hypothetical protein